MANTTNIEITMHSDDLKRVMKAFKAYPLIMAKATRFATIQSLTLANRHLGIYPPKPLGSTYKRTGTLGRRWRFLQGNVSGNARRMRGSLWNVTPYAQWVQDERRQARVHRGRWTTVQQVTRGPFLKLYIRYFMRALNRVAWNLVGR